MAVIVEHDKRKQEILEKALERCCSEGFYDVTVQKIADACGITRTTLYIYFKNKNEIFIWSIKQLTSKIEKQILSFIQDKNLSADECLKKTLFYIVDVCGKHHRLFGVLLTYLIDLQKKGYDPKLLVRRRVLRINHFLTAIIIRGMDSGVFRRLPIRDINDMLYATIETTMFRLAVLNQKDAVEVKDIIALEVSGLLA